MPYLIVGVILLFCAPAVFVTSARLPIMVWTGATALALGIAGVLWSNTIAAEVVAKHPALANTPLQPQLANIFGGILFLYGVGLFIAIGVRSYLISVKVITPR